MRKINRKIGVVWVAVAVLLSGCLTSPTAHPVEATPEPGNTSAVQTIEAQLTGIAGTSLPTPDHSVTTTPTPTETLPPTSTPLPTDPPQPSDTPESASVAPLASGEAPLVELTPTLDTGNPKASLGAPDWVDNFDTADNWPLYNDEHVNMQITDGSLVMTSLVANRKDPWDSWMVTDFDPVRLLYGAERHTRELWRVGPLWDCIPGKPRGDQGLHVRFFLRRRVFAAPVGRRETVHAAAVADRPVCQ